MNLDADVLVYPNPSDGSFIVELLNCQIADEFKIEIRNTLGQIVFSSEESGSIGTSSNCKKEIDLNDHAAKATFTGVYFVEIKTGNVSLRKKIVIE